MSYAGSPSWKFCQVTEKDRCAKHGRIILPTPYNAPPVRIDRSKRSTLLAVFYRPFTLILVTRISLVALSRRGATMDALDVFRVRPDGSVIWKIGRASCRERV